MEEIKQNIEKSRKEPASTIKGVIAIRDRIPRIIEIKPNIINALTTFFIITPK